MVELAADKRLAPEALDVARIQEAAVKDFDGKGGLEDNVLRSVDGPHAAISNVRDDTQLPQAHADRLGVRASQRGDVQERSTMWT